MIADAIPAELKRILDDQAGKVHSDQGPVMSCLAEILTAHEAMVRAKVAKQLREHATGHRRTAERGGVLRFELVRRAKVLEAEAAWITRGEAK